MTIGEHAAPGSSDLELASSETQDRIRFHFFGDNEIRNFRVKWGHLSVRRSRPEITEVACGLINNLDAAFTQKNDLIVGVRDGENRPVEAAMRYRGDPADQRIGKEEPVGGYELRDHRAAYYLGVRAHHYGHFLLETLCRAWAWEEYGAGTVPVIQVSPVEEFAQAMYRLVPDLMERIEIVVAPTRYDRVIVPAPAFVVGYAAHAEFKIFCERMAERADSSGGPMTEQPLYLSRTGLGVEARRHFADEPRLENFLERHGFRIVRPETLPFAEQVALYNRYRWIVAPQGSACHTRLFSRRPVDLVVLTSNLNPNYILCDLLCEGTAHYGKVFTKPDFKQSPNSPSKRSVKLHDENLLALLKQLGLVRGNAAFDDLSADRTP